MIQYIIMFEASLMRKLKQRRHFRKNAQRFRRLSGFVIISYCIRILPINHSVIVHVVPWNS